MVRLVFRPYTHIWRTICTSVSLRASTRVSTGFTLYRHSSPSFGYQQICSSLKSITRRVMIGWWCTGPFLQREFPPKQMPNHAFTFITPSGFPRPTTRIHVRLLGPCFKTGLYRCTFRQSLWIQQRSQQLTHTLRALINRMKLQSKLPQVQSPTQHSTEPLRLSRDPFFLRQVKHISTVKSRSQGSELSPKRQLYPAHLTHLRGRRIDIVHPSTLQETYAQPFWHWQIAQAVRMFRLRCAYRYETLAPITVPFQRFHALFHSLFRVLFIFPSRYLFAIGLVSIFSFRWKYTTHFGAALSSNLYSMKGHRTQRQGRQPGDGSSHPLCCSLFQSTSPRSLCLPGQLPL